ncbi:MAG: RluA family pseudouridine synthase [Ruminococcaceae bacterium]|nr:RluA family pseudouridine synthase [Oscillospiraceae bacterium]
MRAIEYIACESDEGLRCDAVAARQCEITRSSVQQLIASGNVTVNGKTAAKSCRISSGDVICVNIPDAKEVDITPQNIPIEIVYEDDYLLIVNKPKGMVVHPAAGNPDGTLVNALMYHCEGRLSGINGELRPGIVHRIDKDTSGLLVVAKDNDTHVALTQQFSVHSITRMYHAIVYGGFKDDEGFVEAPIGRHPIDRKRMAITEKNSKYAYTSYEVLERYNGFTHVALRLKTGRTHQIRVHMANIGHPVAGDSVYGPKKCITQLNGQCLHAKALGFIHPATNEYVEFDSELPDYFTDFTKTLRAKDNI